MSFSAEEGTERFGGNEMSKFNVEITETLQKIITVEAENEQEALWKVEDMWKNGECILDSENFMGADFHIFDN